LAAGAHVSAAGSFQKKGKPMPGVDPEPERKEESSEVRPLILSRTVADSKTPAPRSGRLRYAVAFFAACALLAGVAFVAYRVARIDAAATEESIKTAILENLRERIPERPDVSDIAKKILPSTVMIYVEYDDGYEGNGSGFFVNDRGDVLTNYHVAEGATEITIITNDDKSYGAGVRAYDASRDMALLSSGVPATESLPLAISSVLPDPGTEIVVAGSPNEFRQSVSNGIVSAIRNLDDIDENFDDATGLQITAPISPGSSGGPVVNMDGEIVGISLGSNGEGQNLNFAVSSIHFAPFIAYAQDRPPMKLAEKKTERRDPGIDSQVRADESLVFVSEDPGYAIYLHKDSITYDEAGDIADIWTMWIPSEAQKASVADALKLTEMPLDYFELNYVMDMEGARGAHVRTINYYEDGSVARDYKVPNLKWETTDENKRIASFFSVIDRIEREMDEDAPGIDGEGIPTPNERGFMGHAWGSGLSELKKRLPSLESVGNLSGVPGTEYFSTGRSFTAFDGNVETIVAYEFFRGRLAKIAFIIHGGDSLGAMSAVVETLNHEFPDFGGFDQRIW
jgi:S1-C subfamily serine protease